MSLINFARRAADPDATLSPQWIESCLRNALPNSACLASLCINLSRLSGASPARKHVLADAIAAALRFACDQAGVTVQPHPDSLTPPPLIPAPQPTQHTQPETTAAAYHDFFAEIEQLTGIGGDAKEWSIDDALVWSEDAIILRHPVAGQFLGTYDVDQQFYAVPIPPHVKPISVLPHLRELCQIPSAETVTIAFGDLSVPIRKRAVRRAEIFSKHLTIEQGNPDVGMP